MKILPVVMDKPKLFMWSAVLVSLFFIVGVAVPSLFPKDVPFMAPLKIDTDPENMLSHDEPVRVFHNDRKKEYSLYDMIVVGVVNTTDPHGVFNPQSLKNIYDLGEYARTIAWQGDAGQEGVIQAEMISPSNVDNIEQAGPGTVRFEWLMSKPPATEDEAQGIYKKAAHLPFLNNTLVSGDGQALALYIPITSKNISYQVAQQLREKISTFSGNDQYHITGLPVAQDTFGVEMFIQMAISAPRRRRARRNPQRRGRATAMPGKPIIPVPTFLPTPFSAIIPTETDLCQSNTCAD